MTRRWMARLNQFGLPRFGLLLSMLAALRAGADAQVTEPYQISVNVDLVMLQATVRNRKGGPIADLSEQNFEVYEDGVRQSIKFFRHEDAPVTVGLVVDHSGSMHHKIAEVVAAARVFVTASRPDDQMFVVNFNDYISVGRTRLSGNTPDNKPDNETDSLRLTNRSQDLAAAITSMPTVGMTALYDGVNTGLNELQSGKPEKKVLIVISDGGDNASKHKLAETLQKAAESSALIYTIGIFDDEDQDKNPEALRRLATVTGGEAFFPKRLEDVVAICERIAREIRTQYTLGYVSNVTVKPGVFRTIRLVANAAGEGKLVAHTRSGYIADGGGPPPKLRVSQ